MKASVFPEAFFVKIMDNNWEDILRLDDQLTEEERKTQHSKPKSETRFWHSKA